MARISLEVNHQQRTIGAHPQMPLLWVLRDLLRMTGKEYGCRIGLCGTYTGAMDGTRTRTCQTPIARGARKRVKCDQLITIREEHGIIPNRSWAR
jgi:aerobic-type carbon monoxide dehydrogenase small subunit (CoxS/CutS family)